MKTLQSNVYYYQDELGSTSHIASATGALLEYYKYDLYGKPTYWNASNSQLPSSSYNVRDLFTGQRWVPELGLYDDRNRFMSPDLGRFLQPDPIGFKGDSSNLYRYCGNDWANKTDPMGLAVFGDQQAQYAQMENERQDENMAEQFNQLPSHVDSEGAVVIDNPSGQAMDAGKNATITMGSQTQAGSTSTAAVPWGANTGAGTNSTGSSSSPNTSGGNTSAASNASNGSNSSTRLGDIFNYGRDSILGQVVHQNNLHRAEVESNIRFANAMVYGVAYPAAAAIAIPVAGPLALNGLYHGGWYAAGAATTAYQTAIAHPDWIANAQGFVQSAFIPGGPPPSNSWEAAGEVTGYFVGP